MKASQKLLIKAALYGTVAAGALPTVALGAEDASMSRVIISASARPDGATEATRSGLLSHSRKNVALPERSTGWDRVTEPSMPVAGASR